jgi:single-strand DNA-binding protein
MVNNVVLVGRLTRDPELRTTTTSKQVATFSIAVQKRIKPQDGSADADFFTVVAWNKDAEYVSNYITKGRLVSVEGRLQSRKYQASDGSWREVVEVVANNVSGLDRPREEGSARPQPTSADVPVAADEYDPFADK